MINRNLRKDILKTCNYMTARRVNEIEITGISIEKLLMINSRNTRTTKRIFIKKNP